MGYREVRTAIQLDSMDAALRASLWNVFSPLFVEPLDSPVYATCHDAELRMRAIWDGFFKQPTDGAPRSAKSANAVLRDMFLKGDYVEVYDLIDFAVQQYRKTFPILEILFNRALEREVSAFRFVDGLLAPISNQHELDVIEEGIGAKGKFTGASTHLRAALKLLSDRSAPDYRNSVKESISAVESAARAITRKPKATLGDLLPMLEKAGHLHPAQKDGFVKLYGYASDEAGIRHAMLDEPSVSFADAKYMLAVCAAFVAYVQAVA
jgi:hypothetical protein